MKELLNVKISNNNFITVLSENKDNDLFMFDEITIKYINGKNSIILFKDFLCEGIRSFYNVLSKSLEGNLQLDKQLHEKGVGYFWNNYCNMLRVSTDVEDVTSKYHLWSTTSQYSNETWMYNIGSNIYIEVSPTYKWFYDSDSNEDDYVTFGEFMDNYKIHDRVLINTRSIETCIKQCEILIDSMWYWIK